VPGVGLGTKLHFRLSRVAADGVPKSWDAGVTDRQQGIARMMAPSLGVTATKNGNASLNLSTNAEPDFACRSWHPLGELLGGESSMRLEAARVPQLSTRVVSGI
jgi:hypothetical protein